VLSVGRTKKRSITRTSGVADHLADNDAHALELARRAVGHLNRIQTGSLALREPRDPLYDPAEMYGVVPVNTRQQLDVRSRHMATMLRDWSEQDCRQLTFLLARLTVDFEKYRSEMYGAANPAPAAGGGS